MMGMQGMVVGLWKAAWKLPRLSVPTEGEVSVSALQRR